MLVCVLADFKDRYDSRVIKLRGGFGFGVEPLHIFVAVLQHANDLAFQRFGFPKIAALRHLEKLFIGDTTPNKKRQS